MTNPHEIGEAKKDAITQAYGWIEKLVVSFGLMVLAVMSCAVIAVIGVVVWWIYPEVIGLTREAITRSWNAETLIVDYSIYGSSDIGGKIYVYWSAEPIDIVEQHYRPFTGNFQIYGDRRHSGWISLVDAGEPNRANIIPCCYYSDDSRQAVMDAPNQGTIIVSQHQIHAP